MFRGRYGGWCVCVCVCVCAGGGVGGGGEGDGAFSKKGNFL